MPHEAERVLIVDDEESMRDLLTSVLGDAGFDAVAVASGAEAVNRLGDGERFDLVLTDLRMPGMSGEELVRHVVRRHPEAAVVIMTGHPSFESAKLALRSGVGDYIEKPFENLDRLVARLRQAVEDHARPAAGGAPADDLQRKIDELESQKSLLDRKIKVTQRNLREQMRSLQKSREIFYTDLSRVMAIIDNLVDGIIFTDPQGVVILINPAAGNMLGIPSFTALGRPLAEVEGNRGLLSLLATHRVMELDERGTEAELSTKDDGAESHYSVHTSSIPDFQGNLSGFLSLIRNISLRKKTEHLKNQFLSIVAHELRTPLTAVKAFATILKKGIYGPLPGPHQSIVENILSQSDRLGHEIDKIISLGRLESSDFVLDLDELGASDLISSLVKPFETEAKEKGVELEIVDDTDGARVSANSRDIRRAIRALMENALKFTPEGGRVTLRIRATEESVIFSVEDTGIGIAPEDHAVIFETFMQLENPLTRKHGGSGLGLCVVAEILKAHGAKIEVESELGEGATFRFRLSRVKSESGDDLATVPGSHTEQIANAKRQLP